MSGIVVQDSIQVSAYVNQATDIIPLQTVKDFLRIDTDYDDSVINSIIEVAMSVAEQYLGRNIVKKEYEIQIHNYSDLFGSGLYLPIYPIREVKSMSYLDSGVLTDIDIANYSLHKDHSNNYLLLQPNSVPVDMNKSGDIFAVVETGVEPIALPPYIRHAVLMHIAYLYENRGDSLPELDIEIPQNVLIMYKKYRIRKFV